MYGSPGYGVNGIEGVSLTPPSSSKGEDRVTLLLLLLLALVLVLVLVLVLLMALLLRLLVLTSHARRYKGDVTLRGLDLYAGCGGL